MLAKLFQRDPMALRLPEVQKAPTKHFLLSGSSLSFRCPPMTATIPGYVNGTDFDFERDTKEEIGDPKNRYKKIYDTGWKLEDSWWNPQSYGSTCMGAFIICNNQYTTPDTSLFQGENLLQQSLQLEKNGFVRFSASTAGVTDDQITEEDITSKKYCKLIYPESSDDMQVLTLNGLIWVSFETYFPDQAPEVCFQTAVGHNHMVRFLFSQSAHGGIDFFSPKHNLKAACRELMNEIMSTVSIELSPEAKKQKDAVIERYGSDQVV